MATRLEFDAATWGNFAGPNFGYVLELYERYLENPESVDETTRRYFDTYGRPKLTTGFDEGKVTEGVSDRQVQITVAAVAYARTIREYGYRAARVNPLEDEPEQLSILDASAYGLTPSDLDSIPAQWVMPDAPSDLHTALDLIERLKSLYTGPLGYDFRHVHDAEELGWLTDYVESGRVNQPMTNEEKKAVWTRLAEVELFERYLHRTFVGQKRFSIEGVDVLVPMLDKLISSSVEAGTRNVQMGMAHRGRLNVLAHVLRKPYAAIFSEFHASPNKELVPSEGSVGINYGWTGDVKYHLGANRTMTEGDIVEARLTLANNPSHLEFVDPVVVGAARAAQDNRSSAGAPVTNVDSALAIVVHGDAAFPGEGVVSETLNMSRLPGYQVGGTVHIIANNQLGFTAEPTESRSTRYASDLAKGFEIPVVHVNADDPEACMAAVLFALAYRKQFNKDFLIDLIGYRRWGHNEMDDPSMTQPLLYKKINEHKTPRAVYQDRLVETGVISTSEYDELEKTIEQRFKDAYQEVATGHVKQTPPVLTALPESDALSAPVDIEQLKIINDEMLKWPSDFTVYPKLERILKRRVGSLGGEGTVDWAHAEALAFGTILSAGTPIRLTGQDSERGTFGHRHLVLHDYNTGTKYSPLQHLSTAKASFDIHNSPLSEASVIGFEYGYDVHAPETLVLWEAQFGDFANAGQVLIDQFVSAGRAKWGQESGLVMLLPHGYEGQGPEHSSARLERYLQMSAEDNWIVANVTTSAQYFHLLRRQALSLAQGPRPLILMTPKSLLRNPKAASPWRELVDGRFQPVLSEGVADKTKVTRLVMCSGKVAVDLMNEREKSGPTEQVAVARVEQLYPFAEEDVVAEMNQYENLREIVWLQEEPKNMGPWPYMQPRLRRVAPEGVTVCYVGREAHSSPAEGMADVHQATQARLVQTVLQDSVLREDVEY